jgi:glutathione S-transferase
MKLYDFELSGNCYKIRLLLSILGLDYEKVAIDFYPGNEHKGDEFLRINPLGQLPVLDDGACRIRDAQAILTYLAAKYDANGSWYPVGDPERLGSTNQWMAFADMITGTASAARLHDGLFYSQIDVEGARSGAHRLFRIMDEHLWFQEREGRDWLVDGNAPTLADIACFPYTMLSLEGGISLQDYPAIRRWTDRVKRIPGFTVMSGIFPAGPEEQPEVAAE